MSFAGKLHGVPRPALRVAGVPADRLREAMGMFATGVTVITTRDSDGRPFGSTANAVSSISLSPPLVLACLHEESKTLAALLVRRKFAINVLHSSQTELSDHFARPAAQHTWEAFAHRSMQDIPVLDGAIAMLRCDLHDIADGGDHSVIVGHVIELEQAGCAEAEPSRPVDDPRVPDLRPTAKGRHENAREASLVPAHQRRFAL